jgi:POT family proton-dependent oligopeptide transporter
MADDGFFGHPPGLGVLVGTEFWDRISFHGMQALLVLYMAGQLLLPGHIEHVVGFTHFRHAIESVTGPLTTQALATQIFGIYVGLVNLTPVFGGLLGDRLIGRRNAVILGATLMASGHFCLAFDRSFLLALSLLIAGAGCLRGNMMSQVGDLYSKTDRRRASAFQIYTAILNTAAFIAPLVTGALAQGYGWHYGFTFAGFGMLVGLVIYVSGAKFVPADALRGARADRAPLAASERHIVWILCIMLPLLTLFWIGQTQIWNTYNLWARDHLNLVVNGWRMPVPWLQAVDSLAAVALVPPVLMLWRWQARRGREPDDLAKIALGSAIFASGVVWLAAGQLVANTAGLVPLLWALAFHFTYNIGYVYVVPIAPALYSRTAPASINALMISVYYLSIFAGSVLSGRLGGLYEKVAPAIFWLIHAAIVAACGLLFWLCAPWLRRQLRLPSASVAKSQ